MERMERMEIITSKDLGIVGSSSNGTSSAVRVGSTPSEAITTTTTTVNTAVELPSHTTDILVVLSAGITEGDCLAALKAADELKKARPDSVNLVFAYFSKGAAGWTFYGPEHAAINKRAKVDPAGYGGVARFFSAYEAIALDGRAEFELAAVGQEILTRMAHTAT